MAFPTTSVLDNFNDTENPMTGWANLLAAPFTGRWASNGSIAEPQDSNSNEYWTASTFGPNSTGVEVWAEIQTVASDTGSVTLWMIYADVGSLNVDGYALTLTKVAGASNDTLQLQSVTNAVGSNIGAAFTQEVSNGDSVGFEQIGSTFTIYYKASGGSWTSLGTRSDATYSGSPNIGMSAGTDVAQNWQLTNFGGGTLVAVGASATPQPKMRFVRPARNDLRTRRAS
jgi:hypothetical protein